MNSDLYDVVVAPGVRMQSRLRFDLARPSELRARSRN